MVAITVSSEERCAAVDGEARTCGGDGENIDMVERNAAVDLRRLATRQGALHSRRDSLGIISFPSSTVTPSAATCWRAHRLSAARDHASMIHQPALEGQSGQESTLSRISLRSDVRHLSPRAPRRRLVTR